MCIPRAHQAQRTTYLQATKQPWDRDAVQHLQVNYKEVIEKVIAINSNQQPSCWEATVLSFYLRDELIKIYRTTLVH